MTDSKQITILSDLPIATLEYFRLALNIAYATDPTGRENCASLCRLINKALEQKQLNYYTSFEELDDDNQMAFI
jgi:hypothetical protein